MKKIFIAIVSIFFLSLGSCDSSKVTPGVYPIAGNWLNVSAGETVTKEWQFNTNGSFYYIYINDGITVLNYSGSYESDGNKITIMYDNGTKTNTGDYSSTETELTLTMDWENGPTVYQRK